MEWTAGSEAGEHASVGNLSIGSPWLYTNLCISKTTKKNRILKNEKVAEDSSDHSVKGANENGENNE